jgi:hypothetical protein
MSNETEKAQVELKADQGSESISRDKYIRASEGQFNSEGLRSSAVVGLGLIPIVFIAMMFTSKRSDRRPEGKMLTSPDARSDDVVVGTSIMTEKDLINMIPKQKSTKSELGRIRVVSLRSVAEVPTASEMKAILVSGATDGIVKARLTAPIVVDGEQIIPENSVLFGQGKSGEERLMIEFRKVIFPTGESFPIRAQGFDPSDLILGLKGAVVGQRTKKIAGAVAFGFLGGMADGMQTTSGSSMFQNQRPSTRDAALGGASKAALDQSQVYMDDLKKSPNIIEVKAGTALIVIVDEPKKKESEGN